jgi:hydroxymethylpyrimidine/phosphomethylpyrimidine kinase
MPLPPRSASPPVVLTFAGSDPTAGGGLQADLLTLASMGCHPLSVITAVTIQDTAGVEGVLAIDSDWVADQARCLLEDIAVDALKIGAVGSVENIAAIAEIVADYAELPLVLDPVLASGTGNEPSGEDMLHALRELLVPQATLVAVNAIEARRLAADEIDDEDPTLAACAGRLLEAGCEYVLITGTHDSTPEIVNTLHGRQGVVRSDRWPRLQGSFHGAGSTLAAAIVAMLANGLDVPEAVKEAQDYTWHALKRAYRPGMGLWVPDRLFWARDDDDTPGEQSSGGVDARSH